MRPPDVVVSNPTTIRMSSAWAMRDSVSRFVRCRPLSIREICEWLVPTSSASCSWLRPLSIRYLMSSQAISRTPSRPACWARYSGLRAARREAASSAVMPTGLGAAARRAPDAGLVEAWLEELTLRDMDRAYHF